MTAVRVDGAAVLMVLGEARPVWEDKDKGVVKEDYETHAALAQIDVALTQPGLRPDTITVQLPQTGVPDGLSMGAVVKATDLVFRAGTGKNGKAYGMFSARALTLASG